MNYPGSGNFFGTRVPGTRLTSVVQTETHLLNCLVCLKGFGLSSDQLMREESFMHRGVPYMLKHGDVVLAAITSCTNATSPLVMLATGTTANFCIDRKRNLKVKKT